MSGHSKWSQIKRQKGAADIKRGQMFTKVGRAISLAVKEGGGSTDPDTNFKLRLAIEKAREINMPKDNIKRAIDRGAGKEEGGAALEQMMYEGYAPFGIAVLIESVTDNRQRTAAELKHILERSGGHLANPGSVAYLFKKQGLMTVSKTDLTADEVLEKVLEAGASDLEEQPDGEYEIYTEAGKLHEVKEKLAGFGFQIDAAELVCKPTTLISIDDKTKAEKVINVMEALEGLDDVQKVYANFNIDQSVLN